MSLPYQHSSTISLETNPYKDRMHKWRQKKYSFVFVLISLTSLVSTDIIQRKSSFRTRLVGLISTKTKQYCFWPPFMHLVNELTASYLHHFHDSYPISITFFGILIKIEHSRKIQIQLTFNIIFIFFEN